MRDYPNKASLISILQGQLLWCCKGFHGVELDELDEFSCIAITRTNKFSVAL